MLKNIINHINSNTEEIAEYINDYFDKKKTVMKETIINVLRGYLEPIPIHYTWSRGDNPHDSSGVLVQDGEVSLNQTVSSFLENEYSKNITATHEKGQGQHYNTYGDELQDDIHELTGEIMKEAICEYVKEQFDISISDDDFEYLQDTCDDFQDIYDECIVYDFFAYEEVISFVELDDVKLTQVI